MNEETRAGRLQKRKIAALQREEEAAVAAAVAAVEAASAEAAAPPAPSGPPPTAPTLSELLATAQQYQDEHTEAAARSLLQAAATPRPLPPAHEAYIKQLEERSAAGEDFLAVPGAQAEFNSMLAALARGLQLNRSEMRERLTPSATHTPVRQDLDEDMEPDATVRGLIAKWKREEAHAAAAAAEKKAAATAATSAAGRKEE